MNKILVITGPTATGKTDLGLKLAKKFDGEILSADSRQVYKGMDIGTGKDRKHRQWGLDLVEPGTQFNVSDYVNYAQKVLEDIWSRQKLPIIVGGSGQYIKELLYPSETLHVPPDPNLRRKNYELWELQDQLRKINPGKWGLMNESDKQNPRRLIRAIEIAVTGLHPVTQGATLSERDVLIIGLTAPNDVLYARINKRVIERVKMGMSRERERLKNFKRPKTLGYNNENVEEWQFAEHGYARRQLTYLKKHLPATAWFDITTPGYQEKIVAAVSWWYSELNGNQKT